MATGFTKQLLGFEQFQGLASQAQDIKKASEHFAKFTNGIGVGAIPLASVEVKR